MTPKSTRPLFGEFKALEIELSEDFDENVPEWVEAFEKSQRELELPN